MSIKLMLAHNYTDQNVIGWHMSEKLDGIRAYWNGSKFFTRTGKNITPPKAFLECMPKGIVLDGELCVGRGKFSETSSIVRKTKDVEKYTEEWLTKITYHVFDSPSEYPFERRMGYLYENVSNKYKYIQIVKQTVVKKQSDIDKELRRIIKLGGEGLMLRESGSMYEGKRSKSLLKVKEFHDMEVRIVGYKEGMGKYKGKLGSYDCETKEGHKFNCGSGLTDDDRDNRLKIRTFITVKYFELSKDGIPRFPVFLRIAERQCF
jgi:DNA ligase 1